MKSWRSVPAVAMASVLLAASAMAQSTSPGPADSPGRTDGASSVASPSPASGAGSATVQSPKPAAKRSRSAVSREQVTAVQQALKDRGHDPGEIDGALGPKTRAALREFQKKEGLKVTGRLDNATLAKLGVGTTAAGSASQPGVEVKPAAGEPSSATASPAATPATSPAATPAPAESKK
jgi:peptidoglycan hydrolase-like protein with peptidoglycan-binding domain